MWGKSFRQRKSQVLKSPVNVNAQRTRQHVSVCPLASEWPWSMQLMFDDELCLSSSGTPSAVIRVSGSSASIPLCLSLASFPGSSQTPDKNPEGSWPSSAIVVSRSAPARLSSLTYALVWSCFCLSRTNPVCDSPLDSICNQVCVGARCGSQPPGCTKQCSFMLPQSSVITSVYNKTIASSRLCRVVFDKHSLCPMLITHFIMWQIRRWLRVYTR